MNQHLKGHDLPPVGVLARTVHIARTLAQDLSISTPKLMSPRSIKGGYIRGHHLSALVVEDSCWPLDEELQEDLRPVLAGGLGYIMSVTRYTFTPEGLAEMKVMIDA